MLNYLFFNVTDSIFQHSRKKIGEKGTAKMGRKQKRSKLDGGGRDAKNKKRRRKF